MSPADMERPIRDMIYPPKIKTHNLLAIEHLKCFMADFHASIDPMTSASSALMPLSWLKATNEHEHRVFLRNLHNRLGV
jgi:hypothetical protein